MRVNRWEEGRYSCTRVNNARRCRSQGINKKGIGETIRKMRVNRGEEGRYNKGLTTREEADTKGSTRRE